MRRWTLFMALVCVSAAAWAGLTGCDSKKKNAREEVFGADSGRDMNARLDEYAEPPAGDETQAGEPATEDASGGGPGGDEQPDGEPTNP